jgi:hypothetical protein
MPRNAPRKSVPERQEDGPEAKKAATGRGGMGQRKASPPGEFSKKVRLLVRTRAGAGRAEEAVCECCGRWLGLYAGEFQHRAARGNGGCRDEVINGCANAVFLCGVAVLGTGCHGRAEKRKADMGMPDKGGKGFWIKHGTTPAYDPRNVPVVLHDGATVWLAADGAGYLREAPEGIAA